MTQEPTYSQIEAAIRAYGSDDHSIDGQERMKAALIAAQSVDRNIYGDCHLGCSIDSIHFMTPTVEERTKIMSWHHAATARLPALEKLVLDQKAQLQENEGVMQAMDGVLRKEITARNDGQYMIAALVQMLGPKARKVWRMWLDKRMRRVHTSWGPDAPLQDGEAIAQLHLDMEAAPKTRVDSVDKHIQQINVKDWVADINAKPQSRIDVV